MDWFALQVDLYFHLTRHVIDWRNTYRSHPTSGPWPDAQRDVSDDASILIEIKILLVHRYSVEIKSVIHHNDEFTHHLGMKRKIHAKWRVTAGVFSHRMAINIDPTPERYRLKFHPRRSIFRYRNESPVHRHSTLARILRHGVERRGHQRFLPIWNICRIEFICINVS